MSLTESDINLVKQLNLCVMNVTKVTKMTLQNLKVIIIMTFYLETPFMPHKNLLHVKQSFIITLF